MNICSPGKGFHVQNRNVKGSIQKFMTGLLNTNNIYQVLGKQCQKGTIFIFLYFLGSLKISILKETILIKIYTTVAERVKWTLTTFSLVYNGFGSNDETKDICIIISFQEFNSIFSKINKDPRCHGQKHFLNKYVCNKNDLRNIRVGKKLLIQKKS